MTRIHYESDFKLTEKAEERFENVPFVFRYVSKKQTYEASFDGTSYVNCKRNTDGTITVIFNNHGLEVGRLKVRREFKVPDDDFVDGVYNAVSNDTTDITLVDGATDGIVVSSTIILPDGSEQGGDTPDVPEEPDVPDIPIEDEVEVEVNPNTQTLTITNGGSVEGNTLTLKKGKVENNILILV